MQIPFRLVAVGLLLWNITFVTGQQKQHITSTMRYFCHFLQRSLPLHEVCVIRCILLLFPAVVFAIARGVCHALHTFAVSCSGLCHYTRCVSRVACFRTGEETERVGVQEVTGHVHRVWQHYTAVAREEQQVSDREQTASCTAGEECYESNS